MTSESWEIYDRMMLWVLDLNPPRKLLARLRSCSLVVANRYEADSLLPTRVRRHESIMWHDTKAKFPLPKVHPNRAWVQLQVGGDTKRFANACKCEVFSLSMEILFRNLASGCMGFLENAEQTPIVWMNRGIDGSSIDIGL